MPFRSFGAVAASFEEERLFVSIVIRAAGDLRVRIRRVFHAGNSRFIA
jgi:hypothetical protein